MVKHPSKKMKGYHAGMDHLYVIQIESVLGPQVLHGVVYTSAEDAEAYLREEHDGEGRVVTLDMYEFHKTEARKRQAMFGWNLLLKDPSEDSSESETIYHYHDGPVMFVLERPCGLVLCVEHSEYGEVEYGEHKDVTRFLCTITSRWALDRLESGLLSVYEVLRSGPHFKVLVDNSMQILSAELWDDLEDDELPQRDVLLTLELPARSYLAEALTGTYPFASATANTQEKALEALQPSLQDTPHEVVRVYREIYREDKHGNW